MGWGQFLGELTSGMSSAAQYQAQKHERNRAWQRAQAWELMAPSLRVEGLKNAGLNPILAAGGLNASGGLNQPMMAQPQGTRFNWDPAAVASAKTMDATRGATVAAAGENVKQQVNATEASHHNMNRAYNESLMSAKLLDRIGKEMDIMDLQKLQMNAFREQTNATTGNILVDSLLKGSEVPGAKATEELYKKYPELRMLNVILRDVRGD